jgi:dihydroorotase
MAVERVARAANECHSKVHLRQLSLADSLDVATRWRRAGVDLTVETTPHYLALTEDDAERRALKVLPPLRTRSDCARLVRGVQYGEIDVIASDHAPHAFAEKYPADGDYARIPAGLPGLETLLSSVLSIFGEQAPIILSEMCAAGPARRFRLSDRGTLEPGKRADLVLVDPHGQWEVPRACKFSRGASVPFSGDTLSGVVQYTILAGHVIFQDGEPAEQPSGEWVKPSRL